MSYANCKVCQIEFYVKPSHLERGWGNYCSKKCQNESQKRGKIIACLICKTEVYKPLKELLASKSGNYFCSRSCQTKWRNTVYSGDRHRNWVVGESAYRHILIRSKRDKFCVLCSNTDIRLLSAHHIDHNRTNNSLTNLTWLCLNCHFLVHHDRELDEKMRKSHL